MYKSKSWPWSGTWLVAAIVSLTLFVLNDPWEVRDGIWFAHLALALPFFVATPLFAYLSLRTHNSHRAVRVTACLILVIYICLPLTWRFADRVINQLIPVLWFGG